METDARLPSTCLGPGLLASPPLSTSVQRVTWRDNLSCAHETMVGLEAVWAVLVIPWESLCSWFFFPTNPPGLCSPGHTFVTSENIDSLVCSHSQDRKVVLTPLGQEHGLSGEPQHGALPPKTSYLSSCLFLMKETGVLRFPLMCGPFAVAGDMSVPSCKQATPWWVRPHTEHGFLELHLHWALCEG